MKTLSGIAARRATARAIGQPEYLQRCRDVVEAAARVFRRKGFAAANLADIAEESAMDRATLYYYTSGKEELFKDAVIEAVRENVLAVEKLRNENTSADSKLAALVACLMESYEHHYPYLYVYIQQNMAHVEKKTKWNRESIALARRFDEAVRAIVQQGLDEGSIISGGSARLLANGVIGMCNWSYRWFHPNEEMDVRSISSTFINMILNGLRPRDIPN